MHLEKHHNHTASIVYFIVLFLSICLIYPTATHSNIVPQTGSAISIHNAVVDQGRAIGKSTIDVEYDATNPNNYASSVLFPSPPSAQISTHIKSQDSDLLYWLNLTGSDNEYSSGIALDDNENAYITGWTWSTDFPTTTVVSLSGIPESVVVKVDSKGNIIYSTIISGVNCYYIGGCDIAVDIEGNAFVVGKDASDDVSVVKINSTATDILYSFSFGGSSTDEYGSGIALDSQGNAYITGYTKSSDFPVTEGAASPSYGGSGDTFVAKINAEGSNLLYATYLGGSASEEARKHGIAVDQTGNAYITGRTWSSDFPTTVDSFDGSYNGNSDVFVTKINADGTNFIYSTFLGGSQTEQGELDAYGAQGGIAVDSADNAYIIGTTQSADFPVTNQAYDTSYNGRGDAFITKLNSTGTDLIYSTFLGGSYRDYGHHIAVGINGNVYLMAQTEYGDFPTTAGAYDPYHNGNWDGVAVKLSSDGQRLLYSTFLGGDWKDFDRGQAIAPGSDGSAYITGELGYTDIIVARLGMINRFQVSGRVIDDTGNGVPDVVISTRTAITAATNTEGYYTISGLPEGEYILTPDKYPYNFSPVSQTTSVPPSVTSVDFTAFRLDLTPPSEVVDLTAQEGVHTGKVDLTWTAPGDDGDVGTATTYTLRYTDTAIETELDWSNANDIPGEPIPQEAGSPQSMTVSDLTPGQTYYFALRTEDEVGNISPLSNSPQAVAKGILFRPDQDGYSFANGSIDRSSWELFRATFGAENVEWSIGGVSIRKPLAEMYYYTNYSGTGTRGNCSGMAASSMLLYKDWADPTDFLSRQGVTQTISLTEPKKSNNVWQLSDVAEFIVRYQGYQQGRQTKTARSAAQGKSLSEMLDALKNAIDNELADPQYIAITGPHGLQNACAGHALMPYAYTEEGSTTRVYVYDSNNPLSTNQYISITGSSWEYNHNNSIGTWKNGQTCMNGSQKLSSSLLVFSLTAWKETPEPPWLGGGAVFLNHAKISTGFNEFIIKGDANLRIENAQGQAVGYRSGELVNEIPGSYVWIPEAVIPEMVYEYPLQYVISSTEALTASMIYSEATQTPLHVFTPGGYVEILGVSNQNGVTDTVRILPDASKVTVRTGSEGANRAFTIVKEKETVGREIRISSFSLSPGDEASLDVGLDSNVVVFYSEHEQGMYDIQLTQTGLTPTKFIAAAPTMGSGDIHSVHLDWDRPVTATVEIDRGGDGTVDDTVVLKNQLAQIYLPIVLK